MCIVCALLDISLVFIVKFMNFYVSNQICNECDVIYDRDHLILKLYLLGGPSLPSSSCSLLHSIGSSSFQMFVSYKGLLIWHLICTRSHIVLHYDVTRRLLQYGWLLASIILEMCATSLMSMVRFYIPSGMMGCP